MLPGPFPPTHFCSFFPPLSLSGPVTSPTAFPLFTSTFIPPVLTPGKLWFRYPSDLGTLQCPVPLCFLPSPYGNASLNIVLTNGTDMQYEVAWCHTCTPPCSLFQSVPSEQIPNPPFLALLAFLAFFLLRFSLLFWGAFPFFSKDFWGFRLAKLFAFVGGGGFLALYKHATKGGSGMSTFKILSRKAQREKKHFPKIRRFLRFAAKICPLWWSNVT